MYKSDLKKRSSALFQALLAAAEKNLNVLEKANGGYPYTQLVVGEMHYHPQVQCDLLRAFVEIQKAFPIGLIGTEGLVPYLSDLHWIDTKRAMTEEEYMRRLIITNVKAVRIFGRMFPDARIEDVENADVRRLARSIDRQCYDLHKLAQEKGGPENLDTADKEEYEYWITLLKNIVLGDRSMWMVKNLLGVQIYRSINEAVLLCGASHTPLREEYRPYSVVKTLEAMHLNYIVAVVPSAVRPLCATDAFDFWSKSDDSEISPYEP